jgi:zinc D-Ala-D-Ala carboxypeptidase
VSLPTVRRHFNPKDALVYLGWRIRNDDDFTRAVEDFQRGFTLPGLPALLVDGKCGPKTKASLQASYDRGKAGKSTASEFFSYKEFACQCRGRYIDCRRIRVHRELLLGLNDYRRVVGGPVAIVSGYRCVRHNAAIGGASSSQHVYGAAADLGYRLSDRAVARLRRFAGIGRNSRSKLVRHVDVRHVSGNNTTGGTPDRATLWNY